MRRSLSVSYYRMKLLSFAGGVLAVLAGMCATQDAFAVCYDRSLYGRWSDEDGDCQNTRHELLQSASTTPVQFSNDKKCYVVEGRWFDEYNERYHSKANQVQIDHLVALAEAHESGAHTWDRDTRRAFANDQANLRITLSKTNQRKGKLDVGEWLPPKQRPTVYLQTWIDIKRKYMLNIDMREALQLREYGMDISGLKIEPEYRCN